MKKRYIIIAVQLVILAFFCAKLVSFNKETFEIAYEDYVRTTIPDDRDGWYIDNTFPCSSDGLFVYTPECQMEPGVYKITVHYDSDVNSNFSKVSASTNAFFGLFSDDIPLPGMLHEVTYQVYLFDHTDDFSVEFYYGQDGYFIAKDVQIVKTNKLIRIEIFIWLMLCIGINIVLFGIDKYGSVDKFLYEKRAWFLILLGTIFVSYPVFTGFMRYGVDIGFHLTRIEGLKTELLNGQFPVKMQTIWCYGYGYPVSLYYGDLFLCIPVFLRMVGFSVQFSYNTLLVLINFATIAIAYWCCNRIVKNHTISYVCAMLYTMMPFRLSEMYQGSTLGEVLAMTFLPLIAYGFLLVFTENVSNEKYKYTWVPLVLGFSGIIQSHILTCVLSGYLTILVCIVLVKRVFVKERFLVLVKTVVYTSLLNAWFLFPCILNMSHLDIRQPYRNALYIQEDGARLHELFAFWGEGDTRLKGIGFCLGLGLLLFIYVYCKWKTSINRQGLFFFWMSVFVLFCSTVYFPWNKLAQLLGSQGMMINNIQFPIRLLGFAAMLAMFCLCYALQELCIHKYDKECRYFAIFLLVLGLISTEYTMYTGNKLDDVRQVYDYAKLGRTDYCVGEYVYFDQVNETKEEYLETRIRMNEFIPNQILTSEGISYQDYLKDKTATSITCENNSESMGFIDLPLLFYEQYEAITSTGEQLQTCYGDNHRLRVMVPAHFSGTIMVDYVRPIWWRICDVISLVSWAIFAFGVNRRIGIERKKK